MKPVDRLLPLLGAALLTALSGCAPAAPTSTPVPTAAVEPSPTAVPADDALEAAVHEAVMEHYGAMFREGDDRTFATEYHEVLRTVPEEGGEEVYLAVLYAQYQEQNGDVAMTGGAGGPCVVRFDVGDDGSYTMTEFWEPEDGEGYAASLKERFPEDVDPTLPADAASICDQQAWDYFAKKNG